MDLVAYTKNKNSSIVRQPLRELKKASVDSDNEIIHDALEFATCKDDFDQVLEALKMRYATVIKGGAGNEDQDFPTGKEYYKVGTREGESAKFYIGHYATIVTGVMQTIARTISCLFTSPYQRWQFTKGEKNAEDIEAAINDHREVGGFEASILACDYIACCVDSALLHVFPKGEWLAYECVWPSEVTAVFPKEIIETISDRREVRRFPDRTDLEDASAVVIKLGKSEDALDANPDACTWMAYVGANLENQYGRMVTYSQAEFWPIPAIGDTSKILSEYERDGVGPCNPMTYVRSLTKSAIGGGNEYPLTVIRGDRRFGASTCIPKSNTLFRVCIEIEKQWSHLLHNADACATGIKTLNLGQGDYQTPKSLDIVVLKGLDASFNIVSQNSSGVQVHLDTLTAGTRSIGASRGVPPYVVIGAAPSQPESGISLAIRTQPLVDGRNLRITLNRQAVGKIFHIEKSLLVEMNPALDSALRDSSMSWHAGEWVPPRDPGVYTDELLKQRDAGFIDHFEGLRRANGLPTIEAAIELDKTFSERDKDYQSADRKTADAKAAKYPPVVEPAPEQDQKTPTDNPEDTEDDGR